MFNELTTDEQIASLTAVALRVLSH